MVENSVCTSGASVALFGDEWERSDDETALARSLNRMNKPCGAPHSFEHRALQLAPGVGAFEGEMVHQFDVAAGMPSTTNRRAHHEDRRRGRAHDEEEDEEEDGHGAEAYTKHSRQRTRGLPTAGWYAIHIALALCSRVELYGFGDSAEGGAPFHYYDPHDLAQWNHTSRREMQSSHNLEVERAYLRRLQRGRQPVRVCYTPATTPRPVALALRERVGALYQHLNVTARQWVEYTRLLYRSAAIDEPRLPRIDEVDVIYDGRLPLARLNRNEWRTYRCEQHPLTPFVYRSPHSAVVAWLYRTPPFAPAPPRAWVEVMHCAGSTFEERGAWFYVTRGSAVFVNTGNTISFDGHQDAVRHFLARGCADSLQCDEEIRRALPEAAAAAGYDSVQFLRHCDLCSHSGGCGHELLLVGASNGRSACPGHVQWRTGPDGREPCECSLSTTFSSLRHGACAVCVGMGL